MLIPTADVYCNGAYELSFKLNRCHDNTEQTSNRNICLAYHLIMKVPISKMYLNGYVEILSAYRQC